MCDHSVLLIVVIVVVHCWPPLYYWSVAVGLLAAAAAAAAVVVVVAMSETAKKPISMLSLPSLLVPAVSQKSPFFRWRFLAVKLLKK